VIEQSAILPELDFKIFTIFRAFDFSATAATKLFFIFYEKTPFVLFTYLVTCSSILGFVCKFGEEWMRWFKRKEISKWKK